MQDLLKELVQITGAHHALCLPFQSLGCLSLNFPAGKVVRALPKNRAIHYVISIMLNIAQPIHAAHAHSRRPTCIKVGSV